MRLFQAISSWRSELYNKKVEKYRLLGKCPDCNGNGFYPWAMSEPVFGFADLINCHGCDGTGQFSNWEMNQT